MSHTATASGRTISGAVEFVLRPIRPSDKAELAARWAALSPDTQRLRFLAPHPRLTGAELRFLTEVDGVDHVAFAATPIDDDRRILGAGRFVRLRDRPDTAEFAITVGDAWQGRGIGRALAMRLTDEARRLGIRRFTATVLGENVAAQRLLARLELRLERVHRLGPVQELEYRLAA